MESVTTVQLQLFDNFIDSSNSMNRSMSGSDSSGNSINHSITGCFGVKMTVKT